MTQAQRIIQAIRAAGSKGLTWGEIQVMRLSTCPWARLTPAERPERFLRKGERLASKPGKDGLLRHFIARG